MIKGEKVVFRFYFIYKCKFFMNDNIDEDDEQMNITNDAMSSGLRLPRSHGVTLDKELITHGGQVSVLTRLESDIMYQ